MDGWMGEGEQNTSIIPQNETGIREQVFYLNDKIPYMIASRLFSWVEGLADGGRDAIWRPARIKTDTGSNARKSKCG
jgi:hypothetical protein